VDVYLGVDVGSVSTNLAVLDEDAIVLLTVYLRTQGDPRSALTEGLTAIRRGLGEAVIVRGAGTTGSARRLAGVLVGADVVKNEIIAHATAARFFFPDVSTVLEIGGQDSKMIILRDGIVVDFAMNSVCAAGTGSFLDQQAFRLGIPIEEFGDYAVRARGKVRIASKCTVFAESDMIHKAQLGAPKEDIIAGLCDAIVRNYLSNVGKGKHIADRIVFQGGVSNNSGVAAAFRQQLGRDVTIPEHRGEMGAIGAALIARRFMLRTGGDSSFLGFEIGEMDFATRIFECDHCPNRCEVVELKREGQLVDRYGHRCSRWDMAAVPRDAPEGASNPLR
jgi:predicted CoA-substrate-specific enzyme activase